MIFADLRPICLGHDHAEEDSGSTAVDISGNGNVTNAGTIHSISVGVQILGTGTVSNSAGAAIYGESIVGLYLAGTAKVTNAGIIASPSGFAGIDLKQGGTVENLAGGRIEGPIGIILIGDGTITNRGTIAGTGGPAMQFLGGTHTLVLDTGSVLQGNVVGGSGSDALILRGSGSETGDRFVNFETLDMQDDAWTLTGAADFSQSAAIHSGVLSIEGTLTTPTLTVASAGLLGGNGTVADGSHDRRAGLAVSAYPAKRGSGTPLMPSPWMAKRLPRSTPSPGKRGSGGLAIEVT